MPKQPITCAIYTRISKEDQNCENQLDLLKEFADKRGWKYNNFVFSDIGCGDDIQPQMKLLLNAARQRRIDIVLIWKFDRFSRSLRTLVNTLYEFEQLGIDFVSYTEMIDTTTPLGRTMFYIVGAMAEYERSIISERTRAGLRKAQRRGISLGRPRVSVNDYEISKLRERHVPWSQIAKKMKCSEATVRRALRKYNEK